MSGSGNLKRIIQEAQPVEIYNLGALSHITVSFESHEYTSKVDGMDTLRDWGNAKNMTRSLHSPAGL